MDARPDAGDAADDGGALDAGGADDGGMADGGAPFDGGWPADAGAPADAGLVDAGSVDAGALDAGHLDAGLVDAGFGDAGSFDAGGGDASFVDDFDDLDTDAWFDMCAPLQPAGDLQPFIAQLTEIDDAGVLLAFHDLDDDERAGICTWASFLADEYVYAGLFAGSFGAAPQLFVSDGCASRDEGSGPAPIAAEPAIVPACRVASSRSS